MRPIKMRDTLRKKATKAESRTDDLTSISGDPLSINSWVEAQSVQNNDPISGQTSKASDRLGPSQRAKDPSESTPKDLQPTSLKNSANDDPQSPPTKVTRRRRTVTKTPHTFELAEDLKPTRPEDSDPYTGEQKSETVNPPISSLRRQARPRDVTPVFTCSKVTTILNLEPVKARSGSLHSPRSAPNPFTINHRHSQSSSHTHSPNILASNPTRFTPPSPTPDSFFGKVVVLVNGASPIGASIVRSFRASGARVILGDSNADVARQLVKSLGEPHLVHFNKCDGRRYEDLLELFKLAFTMYGRVDHAILGVGEDGGGTGGLGEGEKGWFEHAAKGGIEAAEREPPGLVDTLGAAIRFAHIALAYLRHTTKGKCKRDSSLTNRYPDRSLTLLTSVASFKEMPWLPIYQVAQHGVIGLMRSLRSSLDPEKDGVRVNAVVTGMMVPRAFGGG
jgi:NAD(P)-dependent dehydrogenase (short-subunit alcohol dehydrogenase family)